MYVYIYIGILSFKVNMWKFAYVFVTDVFHIVHLLILKPYMISDLLLLIFAHLNCKHKLSKWPNSQTLLHLSLP